MDDLLMVLASWAIFNVLMVDEPAGWDLRTLSARLSGAALARVTVKLRGIAIDATRVEYGNT